MSQQAMLLQQLLLGLLSVMGLWSVIFPPPAAMVIVLITASEQTGSACCTQPISSLSVPTLGLTLDSPVEGGQP